MIAEGMTECAQMAQEMKVSQATVSRFARKAIDAGWLKKKAEITSLSRPKKRPKNEKFVS
jgi:DNA-binding MurR/RpiR family transcriptional regulator